MGEIIGGDGGVRKRRACRGGCVEGKVGGRRTTRTLAIWGRRRGGRNPAALGFSFYRGWNTTVFVFLGWLSPSAAPVRLVHFVCL